MNYQTTSENENTVCPYPKEHINKNKRAHSSDKSIIETHSLYVVETDLEGIYTYMNPFFEKSMGIQSEEWIGRDSLSLIIPDDRELSRLTVKKCVEEPEQTHWVMLRKQLKEGVITTQWECKLVVDRYNIPTGIVAVGHDITSLILKQEALQELVDITAEENKRLVNFTYIVSHNIRSHVANIVGIVNLNDTEKEGERDVAWDMIKSSSSSLDETLSNLNEVISIQTNTTLPISDVDVSVAVDKVVESIPVLISNADTHIAYWSDGNNGLRVNTAYFESILLNLFTNALKYKQEGRPLEIEVELKAAGKYKLLIFKDNGMGIDLAKYRDQLFKLYKTFHGNSDAKGMGLFIIKSQIESMKGKIEVESEVGKGTTFKLYFKNDFA